MYSRAASSILMIGVTALALSACATARMHSEAELNLVGQQCGLAMGELFQDEEEKRLLFLFRSSPTLEERACVARWAKRNRLKPVFIHVAHEPVG